MSAIGEIKKLAADLIKVFIMAFLVIGGVLLFVKYANAEVLSEHNEQHAVENSVSDIMRGEGCIKIKRTRTKRFTLERMDDGSLVMRANTIVFECEESGKVDPPVDNGNGSVVIRWVPPVKRVNGDELPSEEIYGYNVYLVFPGGVGYSEPTFVTTSPSTIELGAGQYRAAVSTLDTSGLESQLSKPVDFSI